MPRCTFRNLIGSVKDAAQHIQAFDLESLHLRYDILRNRVQQKHLIDSRPAGASQACNDIDAEINRIEGQNRLLEARAISVRLEHRNLVDKFAIQAGLRGYYKLEGTLQTRTTVLGIMPQRSHLKEESDLRDLMNSTADKTGRADDGDNDPVWWPSTDK